MAISLASCVEVLDIELEDKDKLLVLNSLISSDTTIRVNISKTISSLDGDAFIKFINDAEVELYEDDEFVEIMTKDTMGYYNSTVKPDLNKKYTVKVKHNNYPDLSASCFLPNPVAITDVNLSVFIDTSYQTWIDPYTGEEIDTFFCEISGDGEASIKINDPADEENYYMVSFSYIRPDYFYDDEGNIYITGYNEFPMYYDLQQLSDDYQYFNLNATTQGYLITDALFNGMEYVIKTNIQTWDFEDIFYDPFLEPIIYVHLYTFNKDVYKFAKSYNMYQDAASNPFAEPVNIFSNVQNGLGLFASYSCSSFAFNLNGLGL